MLKNYWLRVWGSDNWKKKLIKKQLRTKCYQLRVRVRRKCDSKKKRKIKKTKNFPSVQKCHFVHVDTLKPNKNWKNLRTTLCFL